jgi:hypothetical protein
MKSLLAGFFAVLVAACFIFARASFAQSGGTMGGGTMQGGMGSGRIGGTGGGTQAGTGNGMQGGMMESGHARLRAIRRARREACSSKSAGTACVFTRDGQNISGTCQPADDGQMACRNVVGRPGILHRGPPASGMSAGDLPEQ